MSYSYEYRRKVLAMARANPSMTSREILNTVEPDTGKDAANIATIQGWIRQSIGKKALNPAERWTEAMRDEARQMLNDGASLWTVSVHFRHNHGWTPQAATLRRLMPSDWVYAHERQYKRAPEPEHPQPTLCDLSGDSWQRAWDAAEGKTGAAWADTVMQHWLPDIERNSDEQRLQKADAKRRKRQEAREVRESAPGRRLAA